jgi:serine/threonine protein kinase
VAVKFLYTDDAAAFDAAEVASFRAEVALHYNIRSAHVVLVYGCVIDESTRPKPTYAIVMEHMATSVFDRFVKTGAVPAPLPVKLKVLRQLASGLRDLHAEGIMHLDLKSLNVLLDKDGNAKLTDFGLSQMKATISNTATASASQRGQVNTGGTFPWMAPELLNNDPPSRATDVYAFGIVMWEVLAQQQPYADRKFRNVSLLIAFVLGGGRPTMSLLPAHTPDAVKQLITRCVAADPKARPRMDEVVLALEEAELLVEAAQPTQ